MTTLADRLRVLADVLRERGAKFSADTAAEAADHIETLEAALEPFAEAGSSYDEEVTDGQADWPTFKVGQLRAAAAALNPTS